MMAGVGPGALALHELVLRMLHRLVEDGILLAAP